VATYNDFDTIPVHKMMEEEYKQALELEQLAAAVFLLLDSAAKRSVTLDPEVAGHI
jgi:hypothetical protein